MLYQLGSISPMLENKPYRNSYQTRDQRILSLTEALKPFLAATSMQRL
jgi:hypothetical protein